jgi:hypothetical protein
VIHTFCDSGVHFEGTPVKIVMHLLGQAPDGWLPSPRAEARGARSKPTGRLESLTPCSDGLSMVLL